MFRKLAGNKKAIDTILASLLMVVIVVAASVMVFVYATGLFGALTQAPNLQKEALSLEFSSFNSNSSLAINLRNTGSVPITLASYYVKDASGSQYARTSWGTGPNAYTTTVQPNGLGTPTMLVNNACGASCTVTGSSFVFNTGSSYTITLLSNRGSQFSFSVVKYS